MRPPPLACTVRACGAPLTRIDDTFRCVRGHAYDVARRGYVNLLQPQDRKSAEPGDSRDAVEARARLLAAGIGATTIDAIVERAARLPLTGPPVVVDLGSGTGETLARLARTREVCGVGVDLSSAAASHAARHCPGITWVVANVDRGVPLLDASADLVVSVHARRNPSECARILRPSGFLLVAIPAPDDLIELRTAVQGEPRTRDRADPLIVDHQAVFDVVERSTASARLTLGREALLRLLRSTYRGERLRQSARAGALESLTVTFASELVLFSPRRP